tara:strand:- start:4475 stop:5680 length:1206 start_codon:yes stop_codon:yes gene_type:complete
MKITRRQLRNLVEIEVKLTSDEINAAKDTLSQQGGAASPEDFVQAIRLATPGDDDEDLTDEEILNMVKQQTDNISQHPAGDIVDTEKLDERTKTTRMQLIQIIKKELREGDVVDLFPKGKPSPQDKDVLARALAKRAEEMLDLDGDGADIEVRVEPSLFLSPYIDFEGHGKEVPSVVDHVYDNYILGKSGDHAEKMDDIVGRIDIDYFDEDIQYALEALGDDRFTMPHTWKEEEEMVTSPISGDSNEDWIYDLEGEMEAKMQGMASGKVAELEPDDNLAENNINEGIMVPLSGIGNNMKRRDTMADRWSRIAGLDRFSEQYQPGNARKDKRFKEVEVLLAAALELVEKNRTSASKKVEDASEIMDGMADQGAVEQVRKHGDRQTIIDMQDMLNAEGFNWPE